MSAGASTPESPKDSELEAKKREADMAEAESRIQKAIKDIAQAKKDAESAANQDLQRAEQQKAKAQAEQATAEAEKAKFTAGLPASSAKPLEGKVDLDDKAGYFSEILAFESAADGAGKIAKQVAENLGTTKNIYLVKQPDYIKGALQLKEIEQRLQTFDAMFSALGNRYKVEDGNIVLSEAAPLLALAALPAAVGALADVAALFRVDRSVKGHTTTVTDEALMAEVARALRGAEIKKKVTLQVFRPSLDTTPTPSILDALKAIRAKADQAALRLADLRTTLAAMGVKIEITVAKIADTQRKLDKITNDTAADRKDVKDEIKRLKLLFETVPAEKTDERNRLNQAIAEQNTELTRLQTDDGKKQAPLLTKLDELNDSLEGPKNQKALGELAASQFETVIKAFTDFTLKLVSVPDGGNSSPLASLAETCILRDLPTDSLILAVTVAGQGGEVETRKSIWTSGTIYHRAGTACTYTLFSNHGTVVDSGLVVSDRQAKEGKRINPNGGA
jgi:hypothetical protein